MNNPAEPAAFSRPTISVSGAAAKPRDHAPTLSCVIPCRNEARNLDLLLPQLCELLPSITRAWDRMNRLSVVSGSAIR